MTSIFSGDETILVVDDEEKIRDSMRGVLKRFGYKVLLAADGAEAVKVYGKKKDKIQLVIMDLMMPVLNGKDASVEMKKLNPDVKIILSSGYLGSEIGSEMLADATLKYVEKPFHLQELMYAVRAGLDAVKIKKTKPQ